MGSVSIRIDDELEERFNTIVLKKYGYKRGNKLKAYSEAITDWIEKNS